MAGFDGSGNFILRYNFVTDAANGLKILASRQDQMWGDVAAGFGNSLTRDGQGKPAADLNWNTFKITNLGAGTAGTDAAQLQQVQQLAIRGGSVSNLIHNACFSVSQRQGSTTYTPAAAGAWTADRWYLRRGLGVQTGLRLVPTAGDTGNPFFTAAGFGRISGDTGTDPSWLVQSIESINARKLSGYAANTTGVVTVLSMWLRKGATLPSSTVTIALHSAALADAAPFGAAAWVAEASSVFNTSTLSATTYTRVSVAKAGAFTNPASLRVIIVLDNSTATAGVDDLLYATGVKIEQFIGPASSTPTAFEPVDYATDHARCQRYYQVIGNTAGAIATAGYSQGAQVIPMTLLLPVQMFRPPTATRVGTWTNGNCSTPAVTVITQDSITIQTTTSTVGNYSYFNAAAATMTLDAELTA